MTKDRRGEVGPLIRNRPVIREQVQVPLTAWPSSPSRSSSINRLFNFVSTDELVEKIVDSDKNKAPISTAPHKGQVEKPKER
ncbi:Hypothetical predicted protein [Cloeon dipterum]|uniref:Uncharacterized protein n=1 Tax=Cloeon dipterum TaxID=197152 RepID=A0A8S1DU77_9INSE|nr:Hypothetical predicted protein [Cloeon dipterum]